MSYIDATFWLDTLHVLKKICSVDSAGGCVLALEIWPEIRGTQDNIVMISAWSRQGLQQNAGEDASTAIQKTTSLSTNYCHNWWLLS